MTQHQRIRNHPFTTGILTALMLVAVLTVPVTAHAAGGQLLNLPAPTANRFTPPTDLVWPANEGDADICLWPDDKWGAFSITIDDNISGQHQWWISMGNLYDFRATWFIITSWLAEYGGLGAGGDWAAFNTLYAAGHDVQSHSVNHHGNDDTRPDAEVIYEYAESQRLIEENIPGNKCVALAYPSGKGREDIAAQYYISARGTTAVPNRVYRVNYMKTNSGSAGFRAQIDAILTGTSSVSWIDSRYLRGWGCVHFHQVNDQTAAEADLAYMASFDQLWVGKYADVAKYGQERDSAELTMTTNNATQIAFTLSDDMLDSIFDFPLTVKVRLYDTWTTVNATQDGSPIEASLVTYDGNTYALVKAVPDRGTVVLTPAGRIPIPAGFPNASNTGIAGVGLTVGDLTPSGAQTITVDGTIIDMEDVSGLLSIQANNVTIKRCRIDNTGYYWGIRIFSGYTGTVIEDCTMIGNGGSESINGTNYTVRRCDISGSNDGIKVGNDTVVEDCYIHDQFVGPTTHNDCIQALSGSNIIIRRNTLVAPYQDQNSTIILKTDSSFIDNVLIEDNFLTGGSYTVYLRDGGNGAPTNASVLYNTFEKDSCAFGILSVDGTPTYEGNIYHTGEATPQNPPVTNDAPIADAGADQSVVDTDDSGFEDVTLDGSGSSDIDGTIVSYVWEENSVQVATGETAIANLAVGVHTIDLTVTDDDGDSHTDSVVITVDAAPPAGATYTIVSSGTDQEVRANGTFQYSGQAEGRIGSGTSGTDSAFVMVFELPALDAGETILSVSLDFTLLGYSYWYPDGNVDLYGLPYRTSSTVLATDYYQGAYDGDTAATALQDDIMISTEPTGTVSTDATGDANLAAYVSAQYAAGAQSGDYIFVRLNPDIADVTDNEYWNIATGNYSTVSSRPVLTIVTEPINEAPIADAGADQTVVDTDDSGSENATLDGSGSSDTDGTIVSYVWEESSVQIATGVTATVDLAVGVHSIDLTVTDDDGDSHTDSVVITIDPVPTTETTYSIVSSGSDQEVRSNGTLQYSGQAEARIGSGITGSDSAFVMVFELPTLDAGETILSASLDFTLLGYSYFHPGCNADLYGLSYRSDDEVLASDYYQGVYGGDVAATALQDDIMVDYEPAGVVSTDATGEANLAAYVLAQYADGAQGGDFIYVRLNPDIADVTDGRYWNVATGNNSTTVNRPVLTIVTVSLAQSITDGAGDANADNYVDLDDFIILKSNYGTTSNATRSMGDFDNDGDVDLDDFIILKSNYGSHF